MFSKRCVYGLRAVIYLATLEKESFVSIREITQELDLSFYFLTKILQVLSHHNILQSLKGPNGGVRLARPAEKILLIEIILAIDGPGLFEQCIMGLPGCGMMNPCPLHEQWTRALEILKTTLNNTTLAQVARRVREEHLRLTRLNDLGHLLPKKTNNE